MNMKLTAQLSLLADILEFSLPGTRWGFMSITAIHPYRSDTEIVGCFTRSAKPAAPIAITVNFNSCDPFLFESLQDQLMESDIERCVW